MTELDKFWHQQHKKLVEFKRMNGHCRVPRLFEQDKSLGQWVAMQRNNHKHNKLRLDRKRLLDEIGFSWKDERANSMLWHQQHEKLVEFKRTNGHCMVPHRYEQDKALGRWVVKQRVIRALNKMRPDRQELLDKLKFAWKAGPLLVARVSTTDVSGLVIGSFQPLERS
jgi:hypothetical protein